jgi:hypothetical protein
LRGQEFVDALKNTGPMGSSIADRLQKISEGREPAPSSSSKQPQSQFLLQALSNAYPDADSIDFHTRMATRKDFTSGPTARNLTSVNQTISHLDELNHSIDNLGNLNLPLGTLTRYATNPIAGTLSPDVENRINTFNADRKAVTDELSRVFKGQNMSDAEARDWQGLINQFQSGTTQHGMVQEALRLLEGRMQANADSYNRGMKTSKSPFEMLSPTAQQIYARLKGIDMPQGADSWDASGELKGNKAPGSEATLGGGLPPPGSAPTAPGSAAVTAPANMYIPPEIQRLSDQINRGAKTVTLGDKTVLTADQFRSFIQDKVRRGGWTTSGGQTTPPEAPSTGYNTNAY